MLFNSLLASDPGWLNLWASLQLLPGICAAKYSSLGAQARCARVVKATDRSRSLTSSICSTLWLGSIGVGVGTVEL